MIPQEWLNALIGGVLIGFAVSVMLVFNGRVTGISGIISGILVPQKGDFQWRAFFLGGLISGGLFLKILDPDLFVSSVESVEWVQLSVAGLLVGFGTLLGSGCTSGHGVCGISRMSIRSLLATLVFIGAGILTVTLVRNLGGGL